MNSWAAAILLLLAAPLTADAQQAGKVYRVGCMLAAAPNEEGHLVKALTEGLRELDYVEGRFAEGRHERLPALAAAVEQAANSSW